MNLGPSKLDSKIPKSFSANIKEVNFLKIPEKFTTISFSRVNL